MGGVLQDASAILVSDSKRGPMAGLVDLFLILGYICAAGSGRPHRMI